MKVRKLDKIVKIKSFDMVQLTEMGNISEIRYKTTNTEIQIQKYNKDHYIDLRTGEFCNFNHNTTRADDMGSVAQSLKRLREIINTNITEPQNALWVTLTYHENMKNEKRLYEDFRRFHQRLKHYHEKNGLPPYVYVVAAEPQGRGAFHLHLLLIYQKSSPFISNEDISKIWRHGFTKTTALKKVDNVGAYLSAYLGDMSLQKVLKNGKLHLKTAVKEITETDGQSNKNSKYYIKGARLRLYPKGFRLYRTSKGIKLPTVTEMTYHEALKVVGNAPLTFERTIQLEDDNGKVFNIISYKQYNRKAKNIKTKKQS